MQLSVKFKFVELIISQTQQIFNHPALILPRRPFLFAPFANVYFTLRDVYPLPAYQIWENSETFRKANRTQDVRELWTFVHYRRNFRRTNIDLLVLFLCWQKKVAVLEYRQIEYEFQRRRWRRKLQRIFQRVGDGVSPIRSSGFSHPFWAGSPKGPSPSRRFPCRLR